MKGKVRLTSPAMSDRAGGGASPGLRASGVALLVSVADTLGRTVIAPAQVPAGLLTALLGAPYFVWLLHRSGSGAGPR